jgi:nitroreductase
VDAHEALRSTGSVRRFTGQSVSDDTLREILDDARFAPSGGNRQGWRVVVVKDPAVRRQLGAHMQAVWDEYVTVNASGRTAYSTADVQDPTRPAPPYAHVHNDLVESIESVPAVLVIGVDMTQLALMDKDLDRVGIVGGASVYPFCWSALLAARSRGLGGVLTTFLARREPEAASLLGLPATHAIAATLFLGYPEHQPTKLKRKPVESFTTIDRFDGPRF